MIISKNQLGLVFPLVILIVAIVIAAAGAGYYFYKTSVDETADWKVYQDEEHGPNETDYVDDYYKILSTFRFIKE